MDDKKLLAEALAKAKKELERHPGDAPWSCVDCYHGRDCSKKIIYRYAVKAIEAVL